MMGEKTPQKDPDKNDSVREFYLAVGNTTMKLPTLRNLLQALDAQEPNLCALIVCNSRDTLDELASALTWRVRVLRFALRHALGMAEGGARRVQRGG